MQVQKMASEAFERKEMKYRLSASQYEKLLAVACERLEPTEFANSKVTSIYYDTAQFSLIGRSLEKPLYKEKLRLRVYGQQVSAHTPAFVEIKKFKGIVYKRRIGMNLMAALEYLSGSSYEEAVRHHPLRDAAGNPIEPSAQSMQIAREIDFLMKRYAPLVPAMIVSCERRSLADEASGLRITFDTDLRALPLWLVSELSECRAYQQSFSKYGTAYQKMLMRESEDCAQPKLPAPTPAPVSPLQVTRPRTHARTRQQHPLREKVLAHV